MTPRRVRRARRLVSRKWYMRFRIWKMSQLFKFYDRKIMIASPRELAHINTMLTRCAAKEAWYKEKIENQ